MAKPKTVKVGPHEYNIKYSKQAWKDVDFFDTDMVGVCFASTNSILVKAWELSETQIRDTLLHEIMHACFGVFTWDNLPFEIPETKHDVEELVVSLMSPLLLQVLRDNPELVEWLQE